MKLKNFTKNIKVKNITKKLSSEEFIKIKMLIMNENPNSLLSNLNDKILKIYLNHCALSNSFYIFSCNLKRNVIGYAIFAKKYKLIRNEFSFLSKQILFDQIFKIKIKALLNFILIFTYLENIFIKKKKMLVINENLNLNLFAIQNKYQSMGIGKYFLKSCLKKIISHTKFQYLLTETFNNRALSFYLNKMNFKKYCIKIRFFKNLKVLIYKF